METDSQSTNQPAIDQTSQTNQTKTGYIIESEPKQITRSKVRQVYPTDYSNKINTFTELICQDIADYDEEFIEEYKGKKITEQIIDEINSNLHTIKTILVGENSMYFNTLIEQLIQLTWEYKVVIEKVSIKNDRLNEENSNLKDQVKGFCQQLGRAEVHNRNLDAKISEMLKEHHQVKKNWVIKNIETSNLNKQLEKNITKLNAEIDYKNEQIRSLESINGTLRSEISEYKSLISSLESKNHSLQTEFNLYKSKNQLTTGDLRNEIKKLKDQIELQNTKLLQSTQFKKELDSARRQISELTKFKNSMEGIEHEIGFLRNLASKRSESINQLESSKTGLEAEIEELRKQNAGLIESNQINLKTIKEQAEQLETQFVQLEAQSVQLEAQSVQKLVENKESTGVLESKSIIGSFGVIEKVNILDDSTTLISDITSNTLIVQNKRKKGKKKKNLLETSIDHNQIHSITQSQNYSSPTECKHSVDKINKLEIISSKHNPYVVLQKRLIEQQTLKQKVLQQQVYQHIYQKALEQQLQSQQYHVLQQQALQQQALQQQAYQNQIISSQGFQPIFVQPNSIQSTQFVQPGQIIYFVPNQVEPINYMCGENIYYGSDNSYYECDGSGSYYDAYTSSCATYSPSVDISYTSSQEISQGVDV